MELKDNRLEETPSESQKPSRRSRRSRRRRRGPDDRRPEDRGAAPGLEAPADAPRSERATRPAGPNGFASLGLSAELLETLDSVGFCSPTDIQRELIPPALAGRDCLGQAKTGTGKTAAFAIPLLERVQQGGGVQALVLVPTRELAMQVGEHVQMLGRRHPLKTLLVYGGTKIRHNLDRLTKSNREIVVGTPGRVLDLLRRGALDLRKIRIAVLDEVDRMLDIGFRDDIRRILGHIKHKHQTIFVSATIDDEIRKLARTYMDNPAEINVSADRLTVEEIEQDYYTVDQKDKFQALLAFLRHEQPQLVIVFTRTKRGARTIAERLTRAGIESTEIHGDLAQNRRDRVLKDLRSGKIKVLVATDLASRGLDVMEVSHIVNYDVPEDPAVYVHRVGRTARMGKSGYALTFVTPEQGSELTAIEMLINREIKRVEAPWAPQRKPAERPAPSQPGPKPAPDVSRALSPAATAPASDGAPAEGAPTTPPSPPRTLGSRFRPLRRRR